MDRHDSHFQPGPVIGKGITGPSLLVEPSVHAAATARSGASLAYTYLARKGDTAPESILDTILNSDYDYRMILGCLYIRQVSAVQHSSAKPPDCKLRREVSKFRHLGDADLQSVFKKPSILPLSWTACPARSVSAFRLKWSHTSSDIFVTLLRMVGFTCEHIMSDLQPDRPHRSPADRPSPCRRMRRISRQTGPVQERCSDGPH